MKWTSWVTAVVLLGLIGFVVWSSLRVGRVRCEVCIDFAGRQACRAVDGDTESERAHVRHQQRVRVPGLRRDAGDGLRAHAADEGRLPLVTARSGCRSRHGDRGLRGVGELVLERAPDAAALAHHLDEGAQLQARLQ